MKIIYLANIRFPTEKAHGVHYAKMCEALADAGHQVELVTARRYNPNFKKEDLFKFYNIKRNFKVRKLLVIDLLRWIINWGPFGTWLVSATFAKSAFYYTLFKKCDLIYSRDLLPLLLISLLKKNFVFELHEHRDKDRKYYLRLAKKGKGIVVITHQIKKLLIEDGIDQDKIMVSHDAVDIEKLRNKETKELEIRKKLNLPLDSKIIMYTGSLYQWKGVYDLVQITHYPLPITHYAIVLVGGMQYDIDRLKRFIQKKNLPQDKILILGHKPHNEIPYYLAVADVLVLPNSGKKEISQKFTSPMKMFEYMATGKPIVASSLPSILEVLNQNNAVLVESDNPESLAYGVSKALTDKNLANKIVVQAFKDVQEHTWDKRVNKIINFIQ